MAWIEQLSDTSTLAFLEGLKDSKTDKDWWNNISESQRQHINEGLSDAKAGRTVSSTEFWNRLKNG
jgi:predicted transcriptional regulator